jgi:ABC-2 type transport system ATP-binding protein
MAVTSIEISDVSKRFRFFHEKYTSLKERAIHMGKIPYEDFWALKDINFEIYQGQTMGLLGRNGSGKSTLLKCIAGILTPTTGEIRTRGRLAALLELGAGFHSDLSGRENVFLNASLLGLSRKEVAARFDDIVAFSELEAHIDQQVKYYSSGMYVRLGFAVAVNVDPDVLVIDEVLAVGDERFQRKCLDRVKEFQDEGRTIIFVSHSPDQVRAICDEAVVLSDGRMVGHGTPGEAVRIFREHLLEAGEILSLGHGEEEVAPADASVPVNVIDPTDRLHPIRITEVTSEHPSTDDQPYVVTGDPLVIRVRYTAAERTSTASFVIEMHDDMGRILLRTVSGDLGMEFDIPSGQGTVAFRYESFPFSDGVYDVSAGVEHRAGGELYDWKESAVRVEVMNPTKTVGLLNLPVGVTLETTTAGGYSVPA